jgi:methionyl-tRNA formyltransferase
MKLAILCATKRGFSVLRKLREMLPADCKLMVFSFREEPFEPTYFDEIRRFAENSENEFHEARQVGASKFERFWGSAEIDLMFVVSWRYLIPPPVYNRPRLGTFVFHDSLLPQYRGFSPTVWAIINGEKFTGASLFEIAERVDSGPIVAQRRVAIGANESIATVMESVTCAYLDILETTLHPLLGGSIRRVSQNEADATFNCKRLPSDNQIDWNRSATSIHNLIRAVSRPYPGAFTHLKGEKLTIWSACLPEAAPTFAGSIPGRVAEIRKGYGVLVLTGDGSIMIETVQLEGGPKVNAADIVRSLSSTLK